MLIRKIEYVIRCDGGPRGQPCGDFADVDPERGTCEAKARSMNWLQIGRRWYCPKCAAVITAKRPELDTRAKQGA